MLILLVLSLLIIVLLHFLYLLPLVLFILFLPLLSYHQFLLVLHSLLLLLHLQWHIGVNESVEVVHGRWSTLICSVWPLQTSILMARIFHSTAEENHVFHRPLY